tara:strand:+ start:1815 stop:2549 length:735 start_codon:yes stop_codon:yes gene_type:complete
MIPTHSQYFCSELIDELHAIEKEVDNNSFSYTLGFNLVHGEPLRAKIYIRFFDRDDSFLKFFEILPDQNIRQMATHDFHHAHDIAFQNSELGFKGFTIGIAQDLGFNKVSYGWGARVLNAGEISFHGYKFCDDFLFKKIYRYTKAHRTPLRLPFMTQMIEVQHDWLGISEDKYCLCPSLKRDNLIDISNSLSSNLSPECATFHNKTVRRDPNLWLVNMGIGPGEEKVYYHNFSFQNQIKKYLLK